MITSVKKYGSYVLTKNTLYLDDIQDSPDQLEYVSTCSIPSHWIELPLLKIIPYNHDTSIFRFALPTGSSRLGLPVGGFLFAFAPEADHDRSDGIRPYTSITDDDIMNNPNHPSYESIPCFDIICKRYDQWGTKESLTMNFLYTKTDHSYRPPGAVSNYLHQLNIGDKVKFKHNQHCLSRIQYPFQGIKHLMMIAVGIGIAPMIQTLRQIFKDYEKRKTIVEQRKQQRQEARECSTSVDVDDIEMTMEDDDDDKNAHQLEQIVVLYGVRTVKDILLREVLEQWQEQYSSIFKIVFCVGSRWNNIHFATKKKNEYIPPPPPQGFSSLKNAELGWVNEEKILKHGPLPSPETKVLVCGLPGVYDKLCGGRDVKDLSQGSVLQKLGYSADMVVKM